MATLTGFVVSNCNTGESRIYLADTNDETIEVAELDLRQSLDRDNFAINQATNIVIIATKGGSQGTTTIPPDNTNTYPTTITGGKFYLLNPEVVPQVNGKFKIRDKNNPKVAIGNGLTLIDYVNGHKEARDVWENYEYPAGTVISIYRAVGTTPNEPSSNLNDASHYTITIGK